MSDEMKAREYRRAMGINGEDDDVASRGTIETVPLTRTQLHTAKGGRVYLMRFAQLDRGQVVGEHCQISVIPHGRTTPNNGELPLFSAQLHLDELELLAVQVQATIEQIKFARRLRTHEEHDKFALGFLARFDDMVRKINTASADSEMPAKEAEAAETIDAEFEEKEKLQ